nr:UV-endonuclease UvdE [Aureimonas sp. AU22]
MTTRISKLGFPVKVMGRDDLKSNDARRAANNPHLKVSLEYVDKILDYCAANDIGLYRMASDLAPYATHPDLPAFHSQVRECVSELAALGSKARALGLRLSFHPSQFIVLNSPDPDLVRRSVADLLSQAEILDLMGLGPEAVLVIHVGGTYGDVPASRERWVRTWETLPEPVRRRLVLEHDDLRFSASTFCGYTVGRGCVWCSTTSISGAGTRRGWICGRRFRRWFRRGLWARLPRFTIPRRARSFGRCLRWTVRRASGV